MRAYAADTTGDGVLSPADRQVVEAALFSRRGFQLMPNPEFDIRADVLGRGVVDRDVLEWVSRAVAETGGRLGLYDRRPITVAWHYGWYNRVTRPPGLQTVGLLGGDYASWDHNVEGQFNRLKNEFGITVDALSWITARDNFDLLRNYRSGYFQADQLETRYAALLYESTISLPMQGARVDLRSPLVQELIVQDFEEMAMFFREMRDSSVRVFNLDERPVIFLFGSHTWGLFLRLAQQSDALDRIIQLARERFARIYGSFPYLVGEEVLRSFETELDESRWRRMVNFDAICTYHHATNMKKGPTVELPVGSWYIQNQVKALRKTISAVRWVANRYTKNPILIIPNLAPGFAKPGYPSLTMNRGSYLDLMRAVQHVYVNEYLVPYWGAKFGTSLLPAPVYVVGSWNEEWEGHCVFPSRFNLALNSDNQHGFGIPMAIKQMFGWNHYATRPISDGFMNRTDLDENRINTWGR
jgi:hypothetical protein